MKRQRLSSAEVHPTSADRDSPTCNDSYDEILNQNDDEVHIVQNSWFKVRSKIHNDGMNCETNSSGQHLSDEIKSLSQQLLHVKRRLWPAAEKASVAHHSTPSQEFWSARALANPMEALGECRNEGLNQMFINRSAIKLANLDAMFGFELTNSRVNDSGGTNHFLFADLCGAPGGFSEYIMKRIRSKGNDCDCRGYGISLVGKNEHGSGATWRLEDFTQSHTSFSIKYRVLYGSDGTGDLYNWANVESFCNSIQRDLQEAMIPQSKMNLVVADGGFDAQRDSECQEGLAQKLVICELAAALDLLDFGGTLVVKLFGCKTESIRMAMRSMYDFFDSIEMIKPVSSRPASSERYAILSSFKGLPQNWGGGRSWYNSILIGRCLQKDLTFYARLDEFLDNFDRDMLLLNLKACFAILSHLERKSASNESNKNMRRGIEFRENRKRINIKMYKHGWQLFI